ncbi:hypothetical protein DFJ74DRAFT_661862 [Hyaloraphidium curvatum]|nr:hypothetical protein DFJ74DRAFT_661862 [Hyaloraphidium curvatum]
MHRWTIIVTSIAVATMAEERMSGGDMLKVDIRLCQTPVRTEWSSMYVSRLSPLSGFGAASSRNVRFRGSMDDRAPATARWCSLLESSSSAIDPLNLPTVGGTMKPAQMACALALIWVELDGTLQTFHGRDSDEAR